MDHRIPCDVGYYADNDTETECKPCPLGKTSYSG